MRPSQRPPEARILWRYMLYPRRSEPLTHARAGSNNIAPFIARLYLASIEPIMAFRRTVVTMSHFDDINSRTQLFGASHS